MKIKLVKSLEKITGGIVKHLRRLKNLRKYSPGSTGFWNVHCMHSGPISHNIIINYFEAFHNRNYWLIVSCLYADKDDICPNYSVLIVNTCYVSLRSSVCGPYFFLDLILKFQFNKNFSSFGTFQYGNTIILIYMP